MGFEEMYEEIRESQLRDRQLAAELGEEYAEPFEFPLQWDIGAPMPHLMVNDHRTLLAFLLCGPDCEFPSYGLVEFDCCVSVKMGSPNDEVAHGHPLSNRGGEAYSAQRVVNSRWLKELQVINSVHDRYHPEHWSTLQHFIFWFHDSTFECIAESYRAEIHREDFNSLLSRMVDRLTC